MKRKERQDDGRRGRNEARQEGKCKTIRGEGKTEKVDKEEERHSFLLVTRLFPFCCACFLTTSPPSLFSSPTPLLLE